MVEKKKIFTHKRQLYQTMLLSSILGIIITLNSYNINQQKSTSNLIKSQTKNTLHNPKRNLEEIQRKLENDIYKSNQICSKASKELRDYYQTSDITEIDKDNDQELPETDKDYINTLIDIANNIISDEIDEEEETSEEDGELNKSIKKYSSRIWPMLAFLIISFICIVGWIICWIHYCCNCCFCCCCKKKACLIPFYIINLILYIAIISICIYGFTQLNKISK
jgi:hypothetical protein